MSVMDLLVLLIVHHCCSTVLCMSPADPSVRPGGHSGPQGPGCTGGEAGWVPRDCTTGTGSAERGGCQYTSASGCMRSRYHLTGISRASWHSRRNTPRTTTCRPSQQKFRHRLLVGYLSSLVSTSESFLPTLPVCLQAGCHRARVSLPARLAGALVREPHLVAHCVEAFYYRWGSTHGAGDRA
jgi:hypothetical protein